MYRLGKLLITLCIVSVFFSAFAFADVPGLLSYQGVLKDSEGDPVSTVTTIVMTIYDDATASDPANIKWQETHLVTPDENGLFTAILGQGVVPIALTDDVFDGPDRWLGVKIQGDDEQSPRTRIVSNAFSHRVSTVDGSTGGTISGDVSIASDLAVDGNINASGHATIGLDHINSGLGGTFVAGDSNTVAGNRSTIAGGFHNVINSQESFIGGGIGNFIGDSIQTVICGGYANKALGATNFIGSGWKNFTDGYHSAIAGGMEDTASAHYSSVAGGYQNAATQWGSAVGGGQLNKARGSWSVVPGGFGNQVQGSYSFAAGFNSIVNHNGSFVWSDASGGGSSTGNNQFIIRASGGVGIGTNNPTSALHVEGEAKSVVGGVEFYMVPQGAIIMWSGPLASIPSGWALCDGSNGTPNLSDRFIYSVHSGENPGATGGSATIPAHYHSVYHDHAAATTGNNSASQTVLELGGWGVARNPHTHAVDLPGMTVNSSTDGAASNIPPYYKLAFIMKL